MKQIQGSVRVKIKEYVHAWSEFLFVSLLVTFNFFPQINHFYYFTFLNGLQDVENHCVHLRDIELKTGRKKFHISTIRMYYSLCNWTGEHEITKKCACVNVIYFAPVVWHHVQRYCCLGVLFAHAQVSSNSSSYHIRGNQMNCVGE